MHKNPQFGALFEFDTEIERTFHKFEKAKSVSRGDNHIYNCGRRRCVKKSS